MINLSGKSGLAHSDPEDFFKRDVFDYSEMLYNPNRRHSYADSLSSVQFENQYFKRLESVTEVGAIHSCWLYHDRIDKLTVL